MIVLLLLTPILLTTACAPSLTQPPTRTAPSHLQTLDLRAGGFRRSYRLFIPSTREASGPRPLLVALHGAFSSAEAMENESGFSRLAQREGFVVAYPNGYGFLGLLQHWNSGHCCGTARVFGIDDVGFLDRVIDDVIRRVPIDPQRIFVVGFSNGGMLAHRYAAERSARIAGAAVVSGTIGGRPGTGEGVWRIPSPRTAVPVVLIHGTADERIPYGGSAVDGAPGRTWLSVEDAIRFWQKHNRAIELSGTERSGRVVNISWQGERPLMLYRLEAWGHNWPAPAMNPDGDFRFDAAAAIWDFFTSLPG